MITKTHLLYAIIAIAVAALFGITFGMTIACMIPVLFVAFVCFIRENERNPFNWKKAILNGFIPAILGGIIS